MKRSLHKRLNQLETHALEKQGVDCVLQSRAEQHRVLRLLAKDEQLMERYNHFLCCLSELECSHSQPPCQKCLSNSQPLAEADQQYRERLHQLRVDE